MQLQELKSFVDAEPCRTWWRVWVLDPASRSYGSLNVFKDLTGIPRSLYYVDLYFLETGRKGWTPVWEGDIDNDLYTFNIYDDQHLRDWISRLMVTTRKISKINYAPNHYTSAIRRGLTWRFREKARQQQEENP